MSFSDKMILQNKKGSHLAIVLSLLLFIGFLVFLYVMIQPLLQTRGSKQALIDSLKISLPKQLSANLTSVSIYVQDTSPGGICIKIPHEPGLGSLNAIARQEDENSLKTLSDPTYLSIEFPNTFTFIKIDYSEASFDITSSPGTPCDNFAKDTNYVVKSIKTTEKIFESKIIDFISIVDIDYEDSKTILRIPSTSDFGFNFTYSNGTTIGTSEREVTTSIFADEMGIPYIDKEGNHEEGILTIRTW